MIVQLEYLVTALLEYINHPNLITIYGWAVSTACLYLLSIRFKAILQKINKHQDTTVVYSYWLFLSTFYQ